jgi:hypothetical protein
MGRELGITQVSAAKSKTTGVVEAGCFYPPSCPECTTPETGLSIVFSENHRVRRVRKEGRGLLPYSRRPHTPLDTSTLPCTKGECGRHCHPLPQQVLSIV